MLVPYRDYLLQRWVEGCRNAMRLWREIQALGFPGSSSVVSKLVARWRRDQAAGRRPDPLPPATGHLTVRQATLLFLRRPDRLSPEDRRLLDHLVALDATMATAYHLVEDFARIVRGRQGERLDAWIEQAMQAGIKPLRRFASGVKDDPAVRAGLTEVWSNGQTEGQVGKLKLLKRAAYGRAGLPLLRARLLRAS
jgi:transposase